MARKKLRRRRRASPKFRLPRPRVFVAIALVLAAAAGGALWYHGDLRRAALAFEQGRALLAAGKPRRALEHLKTAALLRPDDARTQFELATAYLRSGDGDRARQGFERAGSLGYADPELELLKVQSVLMQRRFDSAIGMIDRQAGGNDDTAWLMLQGQAELGADRVDDAWSTFSKILDAEPDNAAARRGMARIALAEGDVSEAENQVERALAGEADVQTWLLKGELEMSMRRFADARASFDKALEAEPSHAQARSGLVRALLALDDLDAAEKEVARLAAERPNALIVIYLEATVAHRRGDAEQTRRLLRQVLKVQPDHTPSLMLLSKLDYEKGDHEVVVQRLRGFTARYPEDIEARKLFAAALVALEQPVEAIHALEAVESAASDDAGFLEMLGGAHLRAKNFAKGRRYLERARELAPESGGLRAGLAMGHLASGQTARALEEMSAAHELSGGSASTASALVLTLLEAGEVDKALVAAKVIAAKRPDSARAQNLLGAVLESSGDANAALAHFRRAAELEPSYLTASFNVARIALSARRYDEARAIYDAVLQENRTHPIALVGLARVAAAEGRTADRIQLLERARALNPRAVTPRVVLASIHLRRGERDAALEVIKEAEAVAPDNPAVLRARGAASLAANRLDAAVVTLTRLTRLAPRSADAHFRLALAFERKGDRIGIERHLRKAVELEPAHHLARAGLAQVALRSGDASGALEIARRLVAEHPGAIAGHVIVGDALSLLGRGAPAVDAYREAFRLAPSNVTAKKLHDALAAVGRVDEGIEFLRQWTGDSRGSVIARLMLATALQRRGHHDRAILEYERVLYETPESPMALNNLALLYMAKGDRRASELARRAYERLPEHPQVADTLGWVLLNSGDAAGALEYLATARRSAPDDLDIRFHFAAALARTGESARARAELDAILNDRRPFASRDAARTLLGSL